MIPDPDHLYRDGRVTVIAWLLALLIGCAVIGAVIGAIV